MRFPLRSHALDRFIPTRLRSGDVNLLRRARLSVGMSLVGFFALLWAAVVQITWGTALFGFAAGGIAAVDLFLLLSLRFTGSIALLTHAIPLLQFAFGAAVIGVSGGKAVWAFHWLALVPLTAVLVAGPRTGVMWGVINVSAVLGVAWAARSGVVFPIQPDPEVVTAGLFRGAVLSTIATLGLALIYESLRERTLRELVEARRRRIESEQRFRTLTEHASDAIVEWSADGRFLYVSPRVSELTGSPPGSFLGTHWRQHADRASPDDVEAFGEALRLPVESGASSEMSLRFRHVEGDLRWLEMRTRPFQTARNELHMVSVFRDVTERHEVEALRKLTQDLEASIAQRDRAEQALRESEERYRIVAETASDPIFAIDGDSRILFVNRAAEQTFGYTAEELMNRPLTNLIPRALRERHLTGLKRYLETGQRIIRWTGVELTGLHKDGREIPLEVSFGEQVLDGRRLFIGVMRDVTEQRRYQRELRDTAAELERRNAELARTNLELEAFTSVASHDLQEPLRKLVSFSSLLREDLKGDLPADAARDLEFIDDGARRMQRMIHDLLALSRAGMEPVRCERIDVGKCVEHAREDLELRVSESGARIEGCALPVLEADPTLLTGIYRNLLANAIKFAGDGPPRIRLTAEQSGKTWILGVADSGVGLPVDQHEEVFKPFRRLDPVGRSEGSGIGLAFCRRAVERHGGRIWIESEPGRGSHFRFTLEASPLGAPRLGGPEEPR